MSIEQANNPEELHPLLKNEEFAKDIVEIRKIDVGEGHEISTVMWGKKPEEGKPVKYTFLFHGGPGTPPDETHFEMFDKDVDTVILIYQRGVPPSKFDETKDPTWTEEDRSKYPSPSLKNNTTDRLIEDVFKTAESYGVKNANIAAGSWATTLALGVASHAQEDDRLNITGLLLWGVLPGDDSYYNKMISEDNRLIHAPNEYKRIIECLSSEFRTKYPDIEDTVKKDDDSPEKVYSSPPPYIEILKDLYNTVIQTDEDGNPTSAAKAVAARFALFQFKLAVAVNPTDVTNQQIKFILDNNVPELMTGEDAFNTFSLQYPDSNLLEQAKHTLFYVSQGNFLNATGNEPMDPVNLKRIAKTSHIRLIGCSEDHNTWASNANELGVGLVARGATDLQNIYVEGAGHIRTDRLLAQRLKKEAAELPSHGIYQEAA